MVNKKKYSLKCGVIVILLLPLHRIWKIGRVIECAGLEIRYTPFGYRGFESLIFRKHLCKVNRHTQLAEQKEIAVRRTFYSDFFVYFLKLQILLIIIIYKENSKEMSRELMCQ